MEVQNGLALPQTPPSLAAFDSRLDRLRFLSGANLKWIAVSVMAFDHFCKIVLGWFTSEVWWPMYLDGRMSQERFYQIDYFIRFDLYAVGVMAFPLFCFLLSEGFCHTRSKKRYLFSLVFFALISELPFDIGFFRELSLRKGTFPIYTEYQNVFFTLALGLLALMWIERFSSVSGRPAKRAGLLFVQITGVAAMAAAAEFLRADYGSSGVLYIAAFYVGRGNKLCQVFLFLLAFMLSTGNQQTMFLLLSSLMILLYNGKRGRLRRKYLFYWFYPVHIAVLALCTMLLEAFL